MKCFKGQFIFTCRTANIITNMVTISKQAATVSAVIVVNGDATRENSPFGSAVSSNKPKPAARSSLSCCSAPTAMRRFPAGEELMQPPIWFYLKTYYDDENNYIFYLKNNA